MWEEGGAERDWGGDANNQEHGGDWGLGCFDLDLDERNRTGRRLGFSMLRSGADERNKSGASASRDCSVIFLFYPCVKPQEACGWIGSSVW